MRNTHPWPWCLVLLFAGCIPTPAPPPEQAPPAPVGNRPQTQETETVDAEVGVGKSSQNLGKFDSGVQKAVASPAQALVRTKEMAAFDLQVNQRWTPTEHCTATIRRRKKSFGTRSRE